MSEKIDVDQINFSSLLGIDAHWNINKALARDLGIECALIFSDLISKEDYFKNRGELDEDGFFFNTRTNLEKDLGLSSHKQRACLEDLKKKELVFIKLSGSPARNFYKINRIQLLKILTTSSQKISQLDVKNFNNSLYNKNKVKRIKNTIPLELKHTKDIPLVIEAFAKYVDPINKEYYGRQDMRKACDFVLDQYGLDRVLTCVQSIPQLQQSVPFFPDIVNPKMLKMKWVTAKNAIARHMVDKMNKKQTQEDKKTKVSF